MHKSAGSTFSKNVGSWVKLQASSVSPGLLHNEHTSTFWCLRCKESAQKHPVYPVLITSRWLCVYSAGQRRKNRKHFHIMVTGKTRQIVPGLLSAAVLFLNNEPLSALRTNTAFPPSNLTSHISQKPPSSPAHRCSEAARVITCVKMVPMLLAASIDEHKTVRWK